MLKLCKHPTHTFHQHLQSRRPTSRLDDPESTILAEQTGTLGPYVAVPRNTPALRQTGTLGPYVAAPRNTPITLALNNMVKQQIHIPAMKTNTAHASARVRVYHFLASLRIGIEYCLQ